MARHKQIHTSIFIFILLLGFGSCAEKTDSNQGPLLNPDMILNTIADRIWVVVEKDTTVRLPRNVENGKIDFTSAKSWTSGFFPGILWMVGSYDNSRDWSAHARRYTEALEDVQYVTDHHDLGFMLYNSYGKGFEKMKNPEYKDVLLTGANSLASRYSPFIGMIKSWDRPGRWQYPVIIDNMMNLEYFFWVTKETGDSSFYDMAYSHAMKTIEDHYREDYSSYHVVDYDTVSGDPIWKGTHQGLADESVWARGQAWGLYGFTMAYRETGEKQFLDRARAVADYLINHPKMPADKVLYWDLKDPQIPNAPRDASAAAIMASALIELSGYVDQQSDQYLNFGEEILTSLDSKYRYQESEAAGYFYLDQSVGNMPKSKEVSVPIIYADYYFIEALLRLKAL